MKWNWGNALLLFFIIYVSTLAWVLVRSMGMDHHLVAKDYYAQDLAYQQHYDKLIARQTANTTARVAYEPGKHSVSLSFENGKGDEYGTITVYSPIDPALDRDIPFKLEKGQTSCKIPVDHLKTGRWLIKVDWSSQGKSMYQETEIYIPAL